jgi:D-galactose 1-dehydrogenase
LWEIEVATHAGRRLKLSGGGRRLEVDGDVVIDEAPAEYEGIYAHFATLVQQRSSHVDAAPFRLVADAFMLGRRVATEAFIE